ncbi:unnamed protein product [Peniophora sp. CBMAI 1063]|nr:unnamed protein product [Peniophora sp. CBMAI 1063]
MPPIIPLLPAPGAPLVTPVVAGTANTQALVTAQFDTWLIYLNGLSPFYAGDFGPIRQLMLEWMELEHRGELGPRLNQFPALADFNSSMDAVLLAAVDTLKKHPSGINTMPVFIADVFTLYGLRLACAKQELGRFEDGVALVADVRRHMEHINDLVAFLAPRMRWEHYAQPRARESVAGLVGSVFATLGLLRNLAGKKETWYDRLQAPETFGYLDIVYSVLERQPLPRADADVNFNAILTVAERLSGPICFAEQQLAWVKHLKSIGLVSRSELKLSTRQLVALRAPAAMNVEMAVRCWRTECDQEYNPLKVKRCSRCKRVWYCSQECVRLYATLFAIRSSSRTDIKRLRDWPEKHRPVCTTLKLIQETLADEARQEEFKPWYRVL